MSKGENHISKVYFELETESLNQPTEMLQCYYNGYMNGINIEELSLKNGRTALAQIDNRYFVSLSTSHVLSSVNLTSKNRDFPSIPLQFTNSRLKKHYRLILLPASNNDSVYHIEFIPYKNNGHFFKGDVWIDKTTFALLKINLIAENTTMHPLLPLFFGDLISDFSIYITKTFTKTSNTSVLNHINFRYKLNYTSNKSLKASRITKKLKIKTQGVMYFYDYGNPFILPYFEWATGLDDYQKIASLPYNDFLWKHGNGLITTEKQKRARSFFENNGLLFNYTKGQTNIGKFYSQNNILWSDTNRISLKQDIRSTNFLVKEVIIDQLQLVRSDMYNLKAQIFFDVNQYEDSIIHYSATVFDVFQSYYNLPEELNIDFVINVFFDICEIERRKMEEKLNSKTFTLPQLDLVYKETVKEMDTKTKIYFNEVQLGKNMKLLTKWNKYVYEKLGIDNFKLLYEKTH